MRIVPHRRCRIRPVRRRPNELAPPTLRSCPSLNGFRRHVPAWSGRAGATAVRRADSLPPCRLAATWGSSPIRGKNSPAIPNFHLAGSIGPDHGRTPRRKRPGPISRGRQKTSTTHCYSNTTSKLKTRPGVCQAATVVGSRAPETVWAASDERRFAYMIRTARPLASSCCSST